MAFSFKELDQELKSIQDIRGQIEQDNLPTFLRLKLVMNFCLQLQQLANQERFQCCLGPETISVNLKTQAVEINTDDFNQNKHREQFPYLPPEILVEEKYNNMQNFELSGKNMLFPAVGIIMHFLGMKWEDIYTAKEQVIKTRGKTNTELVDLMKFLVFPIDDLKKKSKNIPQEILQKLSDLLRSMQNNKPEQRPTIDAVVHNIKEAIIEPLRAYIVMRDNPHNINNFFLHITNKFAPVDAYGRKNKVSAAKKLIAYLTDANITYDDLLKKLSRDETMCFNKNDIILGIDIHDNLTNIAKKTYQLTFK